MEDSRKILIVDDEETNRAILCEQFSSKFQVLEAENGLRALDIIKEYGCSLEALLLDIKMPVMNGMEVLEAVREQGFLREVPVFLITVDCVHENMRRAYELGVMDIISKPFTPYFIKRRIESVIELFQSRRHLNQVVEHQKNRLVRQSQEIKELNRSIIEVLSTAIEFRDCESGEHVQRISDITNLLLQQLRENQFKGCDFTDEQIEWISMASIMHDVGKIVIPDDILNKPGRLTKEEFEIMKTHTIRGCDILDRIPKNQGAPVYQYAYDICRHHHERWDGRGYPDGLRGDEITIWSQVVSLADVYDALVSKRVYKDAYTHEKAVDMILGGECGIFNPDLMKSFQMIDGNLVKYYKTEGEG